MIEVQGTKKRMDECCMKSTQSSQKNQSQYRFARRHTFFVILLLLLEQLLTNQIGPNTEDGKSHHIRLGGIDKVNRFVTRRVDGLVAGVGIAHAHDDDDDDDGFLVVVVGHNDVFDVSLGWKDDDVCEGCETSKSE